MKAESRRAAPHAHLTGPSPHQDKRKRQEDCRSHTCLEVCGNGHKREDEMSVTHASEKSDINLGYYES